MKSTKKGNNYYFGIKIHVGTDTKGIIHSITATDASVHDSQMFEDLIHGDEEAIYGDKANADASKKKEYKDAGDIWRVHRKATSKKKLHGGDKRFNRKSSPIRSFVENTASMRSKTCGGFEGRRRKASITTSINSAHSQCSRIYSG